MKKTIRMNKRTTIQTTKIMRIKIHYPKTLIYLFLKGRIMKYFPIANHDDEIEFILYF